MRHGSLFSGIGGFDLAAQWMGWENIFHCEWNLFGQKILKQYWPDAISYTDITKTDFSIHRGEIDIITGGFPCQPFSAAGKRKGKEDNRYLWPEMLRAIKEIQPVFIVAENVYGIINQGEGLVFEQVCADLENEGYEVQPYLLPACAVNAPHRRDRFWFVAYSGCFDCYLSIQQWGQKQTEDINSLRGTSKITTNSKSQRLQRSIKTNRSERKERNDKFSNGCNREWEQSTVEVATRLCRMDARIPNRVDRIKALGNAIVPQVAYEIFKAIEKINNNGTP